jgi:hypothetical protein
MTQTFKARLQGNPWDLWGLSKIFSGTNADATLIEAKEPSTVRPDMKTEEGRHQFALFGHETHADLFSNSFRVEYPFSSRDLFDRAVPVLNWINAIGHLLDPDYLPVTLFSCDHPKDRPTSFNLFGGGTKHKNKTGLGQQHQVPFAFDAFELGADNAAISFVMEALNIPTTWASMYLIYEANSDNVGGGKALEQFGFVTTQELSDFRFAANTCRTISEGIRHATKLDAPSPPHIPLSKAREIINRLAIAWLEAWRAEAGKTGEVRTA